MVLPFYPYKESRVITNKSGDITNKDGDEFSLKNGPAKTLRLQQQNMPETIKSGMKPARDGDINKQHGPIIAGYHAAHVAQ